MSKKRRASDAVTSRDSKKNNTGYYITLLMLTTTIIAGWHITDVWSGVICLLCGLITIALQNELINGRM